MSDDFKNVALLNAALSSLMEGHIFITYEEFTVRRRRGESAESQPVDFKSFFDYNLVGAPSTSVYQRPNPQQPSANNPSAAASTTQIEVLVKVLSDKTLTIKCNASDLVSVLKQKIWDQGQHIKDDILPPNQMRIIHSRTRDILEDGRQLSDYGIEDKSILHLVFRVRKSTGGGFMTAYLNPDSLQEQFDYDFRGKDVQNEASHKRGGVLYQRPCGWMRWAIKVLGKYEDGNQWLMTDDNSWQVSYHGTAKNNGKSIGEDGCALTQVARNSPFSKGIYTTPDVALAKKYAQEFDFNGGKYLVMFQNRVNPGRNEIVKVKSANGAVYWVSKDGGVRPYGICIIKKA